MSEVQMISAFEWLRLIPRSYCFYCKMLYFVHQVGCGQHGDMPEKTLLSKENLGE